LTRVKVPKPRVHKEMLKRARDLTYSPSFFAPITEPWRALKDFLTGKML